MSDVGVSEAGAGVARGLVRSGGGRRGVRFCCLLFSLSVSLSAPISLSPGPPSLSPVSLCLPPSLPAPLGLPPLSLHLRAHIGGRLADRHHGMLRRRRRSRSGRSPPRALLDKRQGTAVGDGSHVPHQRPEPLVRGGLSEKGPSFCGGGGTAVLRAPRGRGGVGGLM